MGYEQQRVMRACGKGIDTTGGSPLLAWAWVTGEIEVTFEIPTEGTPQSCKGAHPTFNRTTSYLEGGSPAEEVGTIISNYMRYRLHPSPTSTMPRKACFSPSRCTSPFHALPSAYEPSNA